MAYTQPIITDTNLFIMSLCCFVPLLVSGIGIALVIRAAQQIPWDQLIIDPPEDT